mmetsp:Transcript_15710/g.26195  ORF Transcript_15710/g.26195 Transcript_15710/m.26195 type:complete len:211 (+) Transcript_15710:282-914(+)
MVHRVHRHTSGDGPLVTLSLVLVESTASLQQGLVSTTTSSHNTNGSTAQVAESALGTGRHADASGTLVLVLCDDDAVVTGSLGHLALVAGLGLDVADDGTLGQVTERKDVANSKTSLLSGIDELTSVHTLGGNNSGVDLLEAVGVLVLHSGKGSTTTLIVKDLSYNSLGVSVSLSEISPLVHGSALTAHLMAGEDTSLTSSLSTNNLSHL